MLVSSAKNRSVIKAYLESISEDELIDEIIVPLYRSFGYAVLRIVTHGPGEHGKDLVVYKKSSAIFGYEYIAIQAKAQNVNTSNIADMANQLIRALRTPIKGLSGGSEFLPNYVIHFNSKSVTNDAHWEFPYLVDGKDNIRIVSQDNVIDLMLDNDISPSAIEGRLEKADTTTLNELNIKIQQTLYSGSSSDIDFLFENIISISKENIDNPTKHMIIEYIFKKWNEDKRWEATVKPMKWLDNCFEFMFKDQYKYLKEVLDEYTSSFPSYDASGYVESIVNKMSVEHYEEIKDYFMQKTISDYRQRRGKDLYKRFFTFLTRVSSNDISDQEKELKAIIEKMNALYKKHPFEESDQKEWEALDKKLMIMEYGEENARLLGAL